jgi:hypothetical protein
MNRRKQFQLCTTVHRKCLQSPSRQENPGSFSHFIAACLDVSNANIFRFVGAYHAVRFENPMHV